MAINSEIEEILSLKSVDVYQLSYNRNQSEYELNSLIKDQNFRIFREVIEPNVDQKQRDLSQRLALIKVKDWFYPLEKDKTNVFRYRDQYLCYLFPDMSNTESLSIVFINTSVVDEIKVLLLENVLQLYCDLKDAPIEWKPIISQLATTPSAPSEPPLVASEEPMETTESEPIGAQSQPGMADTIAKNIVYGAELLNNGITYGTQMANNFIKRSAAQLRANQSTEPIQSREIDPRVTTGLTGLRKASHTACAVTGYAVNTVAKGTNQLGKCLAPHVKSQSKKLISSVSGKTDNDSEKICDNICTVASGGLQAFGHLYNGVTENAKILAKTVTTETVDIVNRNYGPHYGLATEQALYTAGNSALTFQNVQHLGPKAIAKRAALDTGKTAILDKTTEDSDESQRKT